MPIPGQVRPTQRLPDTVRRAKLPFDILNVFDEEATREFGRLLNQAFAIIEAEVANDEGDPEAMVLQGANEPLKRATDSGEIEEIQERKSVEQAVVDYGRRARYGAPTRPGGQLADSEIDRILHMIPFKSGELRMDMQRARVPMQELSKLKWERKIIALERVVALMPLSSVELKESLQEAKARTIRTIELKGSDDVTVLVGSAEVLAGLINFVPALPMLVARPKEPGMLEMETQPTVTLDEMVALGRFITRDWVYRLPSVFEPVAEQARKFSADDPVGFGRAFEGTVSYREEELREKADLADLKRMQFWQKLYNRFRKDHGETEALRMVRAHSEWKKVEQRALNALRRMEDAEKEGHEKREAVRAADKRVDELAKEDGLKVVPTNPIQLYIEANKGVGGFLKDDLTTAFISDIIPTDVMETATFDTFPDESINEDMDIKIDKFNVILPKDTNSFRIEEELTPITAEMNATALVVNSQTWKKNREAKMREFRGKEEQARQIAGDLTLNVGSSRDCSRILFEENGLPVQRINKKTGVPACDKETLQVLHNMGSSSAGAIIEAREAKTQLSQLNKWKPFAEAGQVQCNWLQLGTPHGRYACESPNLQNRIVAIRETIEAPQGMQLLSFDLGQTEYVTFASLSKDPTLTAAFLAGKDFHSAMYDELREAVPELANLKDLGRKIGKTINFAILYLMQAFTLAKRLGADVKTAEKILVNYNQRAPIAAKYIVDYLERARLNGKAETAFGRVRLMPELKRARGADLHKQQKTAWHHHNAGTAAELMKIKQIKAWKAVRRSFDEADVRLALQMHDELIFVVKDELVDSVGQAVQASLDEPIKGFINFVTDRRVGRNWGQTSK